MRIIGINYDMYLSSACLLQDGEIVAAVAEERLSRSKLTREFPARAVDFCLRQAGLEAGDVDHWALSWNPGSYFAKFNPIFSGRRRHLVEHLYSVPDFVMEHYQRPDVDTVRQQIGADGPEIQYFTHHRCHAANAFFLSPFESAAILTADAQGELESTTLCKGRGSRIELLETMPYPQSLGMLYSSLTEFLGFRPNSDEWKVMAMASYAPGDSRYREAFGKLLQLEDDGRYSLDLRYFSGFLHDQPGLCTSRMAELLGCPRAPGEPLEERHYQIAAALQHAAEEAAVALLHRLHRLTGEKNLALSGGFFMNSVLNGKVLERTPFENLYISSCPDDSGNCFGAALYLHNHVLGAPRGPAMRHNSFGPAYSAEEVEATLRAFKLHFEKPASISAAVAELLAGGNIVGWFQGRMEFGQRALGNRSILADPRSADMKDVVNRAVKFREPFRPFAPAVLRERQEEFFRIGQAGDVPFMEKVYPVQPQHAATIPAVVHVDGSCRVQTVDKELSPKFHEVISEFERLTGVPVLMNTSFNLNGEAIVCSPEDALRTFYTCGLDALAIEDCLIVKQPLG